MKYMTERVTLFLTLDFCLCITNKNQEHMWDVMWNPVLSVFIKSCDSEFSLWGGLRIEQICFCNYNQHVALWSKPRHINNHIYNTKYLAVSHLVRAKHPFHTFFLRFLGGAISSFTHNNTVRCIHKAFSCLLDLTHAFLSLLQSFKIGGINTNYTNNL